MKPIILAALLATSSTAVLAASDEQPKNSAHVQQCIYKANVFRGAAMYRDAKHSPEDAFANLRHGFPTLDEKFIKVAINDVYFNRDFAYAGGQALLEQMLDLCLHGPNNWKPLK